MQNHSAILLTFIGLKKTVLKTIFGMPFKWPLKIGFTVLADIYTADELRHFRLEIDAMKSLGSHPHLVSIIGCCSGPIHCLLMDYCALGDLKNYLRKYREKVRRADMCGSRGGTGGRNQTS